MAVGRQRPRSRPLRARVCRRAGAALDRPLEPGVSGVLATIPRLTPPLCDWCGDLLPGAHAPYDLCARCLAAPPPFDAARSAGLYDGTLRTLIHAFKYQRRRMLAAPARRLMSPRRDAAAGGRRRGGARAAASPADPASRFQPGRRPGSAPRLARLAAPAARAPRSAASRACLPHRRARNVSGAFARALAVHDWRSGAPSPPRAAARHCGADRRRDDHRSDAGRLQPRAGRGRRQECAGADGGASRDSTACATAAATSSFDAPRR